MPVFVPTIGRTAPAAAVSTVHATARALRRGAGPHPLSGALVAIAVLAGLLAVIAFALLLASRRQMRAARGRGAADATVLATIERLWPLQTRAELLEPLAEAALALARGTTVTAYLPDPEDPAWFSRVALVPLDATTSGPIHVPIAFAEQGITITATGWLLVPLTCEGATPAGLLVVMGTSGHLTGEVHAALQALAEHAAHALANARRHEQVLAQASADGLTGLLNHRAFQVRLEEELARAHHQGQPLSVMMIDLDNFGTINNRYGHQVGDATLVAVALALRHNARPGDVAARYGGDEFAMILPGATIATACAAAQRIRTVINALTAAELGIDLPIDASIGVATSPRHALAREDLLRAADQAAYAAKHAGKGRVGQPEDAAFAAIGDPTAAVAQLEHANMATVEALAAAVDAKDPYTRGHAQRVSLYAGAIATALGLSPEEIGHLRLAGLLHDVGKIGVPDAILTKAGPLSDAEFARLQQHPVIGEKMLAAVPFLQTLLPAIRHHHERWDGRGYPDGLAGVAIPTDAAIVMVADAFDAMTTSRPYRPALPLHEARRRVRDGSGSQFAPAIVNAFECAYDDGLIRALPAGSTKLLDAQELEAARASTRLGQDQPTARVPRFRRAG